MSGLTDKVIEFKDGSIKEYLGDIEYFLGKKKMDNMRSVELQKSETSSSDQNTSISGKKMILNNPEN